jgi:hypothetical protein
MIIVPFERLEINGKVYYQPQQKQLTFHNAIHNRAVSGYRDFLYGGAAKGGKSHALRWEAHRNCLLYPKLRVLLIRSSFPELERTHIRDLMFDLPPKMGSYNSQKHVFTYKNDSILELGYGSSMADFEQYLSANYDAILVDEMTTIPFELTYMFRLRLQASRPDFIPFFAGATNPGSTAHVQVRSYFVKKNASPEQYPGYDPKKICFIPATVYDNTILIDRDPEVLVRLHQLPPREQQKYLYGNWDIFEGQFFDNWNPEIHIIKPQDYLPYFELKEMFVRGGMDYGNNTVLEMGARDHNGNIVFFDELYHDIKVDKKVRIEKVLDTKKFLTDRKLEEETIIADTNMWNPDAFDMAKEQYAAQYYLNAKIKLVKVSKASPDKRNYRVACNDAIYNGLHYKLDENGKLIQPPTLKIYERCAWLIETLPSLITDDKDQEDIADGQNDHPFDAMKHAYMTLIQPKKKTPDNRPQWLKQFEKEKIEKVNFMVK